MELIKDSLNMNLDKAGKTQWHQTDFLQDV
jgi:hypothetical protein